MTQTPPPDAPRSPDGHYWWDGEAWQPVVPQAGGTPETGGPIQIGGTHVLADTHQHPRAAELSSDDGPGDGTPRLAMAPRRLIVVGGVALLLAIIAAFALTRGGSDDDNKATNRPTNSKSPSASVVPAAQRAKNVRSYLTQAAAAQKRHEAKHGTYAKKPADLVKAGLKQRKGYTLRVISATKTRYCLQAGIGGKDLQYLDSATGKPSTKACK